MLNKDNLEVYLIQNCKSWKSIDSIQDFHRFSFPLRNAELDTKYSRDHYHSSDKTKCYYWHSGGADIGNSFNYIVKKILKDFKKGIINITEFQADNKIQVSAGKSTNNNPELKTKGENDE